MSYRTLKRLLGETSLERKCRMLFGSVLLLLIVGSFLLCQALNRKVVFDEKADIARVLVGPVLHQLHAGAGRPVPGGATGGPGAGAGENDEIEDGVGIVPRPPGASAGDSAVDLGLFLPTDLPAELRGFRYRVYAADPTAAAQIYSPGDAAGFDALAALRGGAAELNAVEETEAGPVYHHYYAVRNDARCAGCHAHAGARAGELLGAVHVTLPLSATTASLARNTAFLFVTGVVTAVLAMFAAWVIVRYVIVKPVLHLKDVADEIARGTLDLRSDIRTGDEFEELSQAFNRMLRHLLTMQDELKEVNGDLDGKVDELARANMELYETNRLKDEFLATMSHELRTPLNSILGFSEVLENSPALDGKQKKWVGNIRNGGRDLKLLIDDILDLAKIESGKLEVTPGRVNLSDLAERQADALRPVAEKKGVALSVRVDRHLPELRQDGGKLQQILNNLLSNAIKFTPGGGEVRVRGRDLGPRDAAGGPAAGRAGGTGPAGRHGVRRWFELVVSDTGVGIPLEDQGVIFEKFRQARGRAPDGRATDAMTREHGGTGLGLSIVRELCRLLGGEVTCTSEYGRGSTFTVRLPCEFPGVDAGRDADAGHDSDADRPAPLAEPAVPRPARREPVAAA